MSPLVPWRLRTLRTRRELLASVVVSGGLGAFVALAYVVFVLGGGVLFGTSSSARLGLSVLATAVVALAFDPVQRRLESFAARVVLGGQPSPYDVLRRFTSTLADSGPEEQLPQRVARILAEGTGAQWVQVWVAMEDRSQLAATWPPRAGPGPAASPVRWMAVRHGGDVFGTLVLREREGVPLTPVEERLFADLAGQAGLVLRGARLRAQLELRLTQLSVREAELRTSRQRLVDAQDAERRRLERDIHDGAQQHLVALAVNLRLAGTLAARSPDRADALLADQERAAADAVTTLLHLSRGIYPPQLADLGLAEALPSAVDGAEPPVELSAVDVGRYPSRIEATAYFCCLEALQNAAKHAGATRVRVELRGTPESLELSVVDDGRGFASTAGPGGAGLANLRDRVESVGGSLTVASAPGQGTRIHAVLPLAAPVLSRGGA
jgi:signal transduction histidine kinase